MRKITFSGIFTLCAVFTFAQQLFVEAYSGYHLTNYDRDIYSSSAGYFPIGFKLGGGHEHVQGGLEYRTHITNPEFEIDENQAALKHEFDETYYGAFIRGNISSLPAYRFGLILSAGAGYYKPTLDASITDAEGNLLHVEYEKKFGYNFYVGISAPIYAQLHWELGYQYNIVKRQEMEEFDIPEYGADYHSIHVGLSGNFVFGNTEKRCRRVISSSRRR